MDKVRPGRWDILELVTVKTINKVMVGRAMKSAKVFYRFSCLK